MSEWASMIRVRPRFLPEKWNQSERKIQNIFKVYDNPQPYKSYSKTISTPGCLVLADLYACIYF